jgi:DNA replication protein DnaC
VTPVHVRRGAVHVFNADNLKGKTMLLEETCDKLTRMKLSGMLNGVRARLEDPSHRDLSFTELLGLIVDDEWLYRENRKLTILLKKARFKEKMACLEDVDYRAGRGLKKAQVLEVAQNRYIDHHQNVLITGPSGAGKSYLAQAFGNHACRHGFRVHYVRMPKLAYAFVQARADGTYPRLLKSLAKYELVILDDFGLAPLAEKEKQDLVELAEERYGSGSTMVTSQLPVKAWHDYLGGSRIADALLDRLIHNAHRFELAAQQSMRKGKADLTSNSDSEK